VKPRRKIGLLTSSEGHFSIAEAIRQTLEPTYDVAVFKQKVAFNEGYKLIYRLFPAAFAIPFTLAKKSSIYLLVRKLFFLRNRSSLLSFFKREKPEICINTYFMYLDALSWYQKYHQAHTINVIADPWSIHPIEFATSPMLNVCFDETSLQAADEYPFPVHAQPWGWFVRPAYEVRYDQAEIRKELNLDPATLTFVLAGGSEGSLKVSELLPHLLKITVPLQLIVVCGSNRLMLKQIKVMYEGKTPSNITFIPLGFTDHLEKYMQAADLVIGKAGPNMVFEAVATLTPFFAVTHISGQEDGNLEIIKHYNLGYVEEHIPTAAAKLVEIAQAPQQLTTFQPSLKKLAAYNASAKTRLLAYLESYGQ
jgi:processive 1,2-diacylglycerol beta-glucosyltransferase